MGKIKTTVKVLFFLEVITIILLAALNYFKSGGSNPYYKIGIFVFLIWFFLPIFIVKLLNLYFVNKGNYLIARILIILNIFLTLGFEVASIIGHVDLWNINSDSP